jgi:hypothetical protein
MPCFRTQSLPSLFPSSSQNSFAQPSWPRKSAEVADKRHWSRTASAAPHPALGEPGQHSDGATHAARCTGWHSLILASPDSPLPHPGCTRILYRSAHSRTSLHTRPIFLRQQTAERLREWHRQPLSFTHKRPTTPSPSKEGNNNNDTVPTIHIEPYTHTYM